MASIFNTQERLADGYSFDSLRASLYYQNAKRLQEAGKIKNIKVRPVYILQEKFIQNNKVIREITYQPDFQITFPDGRIAVIDARDTATGSDRIKKKLFMYQNKDIQLIELKEAVT